MIKKVEKESIAEIMGIRPGDQLLEINGHPIRDIIDYQFYSADEILDCTFLTNNKVKKIQINLEEENIGLEFEPMRFKRCGNHCIFCFIDQNPKGLRKSLYFKDEDYRLSFLYGNYVTLTNVTKSDMERIVEQKLSPLYVSIHATDPEIRKTLLGLKRKDYLLEKIHFLTNHSIELHGQIVICPGINDGEVLHRTLQTLSSFFPGLRSVAVVPVGLTRHRKGLPKLKKHNPESVLDIIRIVQTLQEEYEKKFGEPFVYLSDEFYLLVGKPLPSSFHYRDFWQIENGVGLTRFFLSSFEDSARTFPSKLKKKQHLVFVTGTMAEPILRENVLPVLNRIKNLSVRLLPISNRFFGESVTVSGLLTGKDIINTLQKENKDTTILLPSNCLNTDNLFLDDVSLEELRRKLNRKIIVVEDFKTFWEEI